MRNGGGKGRDGAIGPAVPVLQLVPGNEARFARIEETLDRIGKVAMRAEKQVENEKAWRMGLDDEITTIRVEVHECGNMVASINQRIDNLAEKFQLLHALFEPPTDPTEPTKLTGKTAGKRSKRHGR